MSRIRTVAGSSVFGNIVGALTLIATLVLGVLGLRSDQGQTAVRAVASIGIGSAHSVFFWVFLVFAAALGIGLLLPSWIALFGTIRSATVARPALAIPPDSALSKIEEVINQTFKNQEVLLDNHAYFACTFENCSFVYDFGPTGGFGPGCKFAGSRGIKGSDPRLQHLLQFLQSLGLLNPFLKPLYTPKNSTLIAEDSLEDEAQREIHIVLNSRDHPYWDEKKQGHKDAVERMQKLYQIAYPNGQSAPPAPVAPTSSLLERKEYRPPTANEILAFLNSMKQVAAPFKMRVKVISTSKGRVLAGPISDALLSLGFELRINTADASIIFPAPVDQPDGIRLQAPTNLINPMLVALQAALGSLNVTHKLQNFPHGPAYDYIQIEVGNRESGAQC